MKITVYCDREGILRYNPDGWPVTPVKPTGFNSHAGFVHMGGDFGHEKTVKKYNTALEKAKSESVPFENQKITAEWAHIIPDSFYDVDIEGTIEILETGPKANLMGQGFHLKKFKDSPKVARIVKNELSGNSGQLQSNGWIKSSERMPDFNVGVLVFIPEEDHHITAGMWDVSEKWVLLDEYRIPQSEVTYWMPMPEEPIDKTYKKSNRVEQTTTELIRELQKENFLLKSKK